MIVEERRYGLVPGGPARYLEAWRERGRAPQVRHLGEPLGVLTSAFGDVNELTYLWGFADHGDRDHRRAALMADTDFATFRASVRDLMVSQRTRLLIPTDGTLTHPRRPAP